MHWLSEFRFRFNHIKNGACVNRGFAGKFKPKTEEKVNLGKKKKLKMNHLFIKLTR
jgi:hypothetical protein